MKNVAQRPISENRLWKFACSIPELGKGGLTLKDTLFDLAHSVPDGDQIVEVAPWLGSASAFLCLGILQSGNRRTALHAYDLWTVDECYRQKARVYNGLDLAIGTDLQPMWERNVIPFGAPTVPHKGDVYKQRWSGQPIGLLVDDISNLGTMTEDLMRIFGNYIVPGARVVFMDFGFLEERGNNVQRKWMEEHSEEYELETICEFPCRAAIYKKRIG